MRKYHCELHVLTLPATIPTQALDEDRAHALDKIADSIAGNEADTKPSRIQHIRVISIALTVQVYHPRYFARASASAKI
jgi:hypothetical protein